MEQVTCKVQDLLVTPGEGRAGLWCAGQELKDCRRGAEGHRGAGVSQQSRQAALPMSWRSILPRRIQQGPRSNVEG